MGRAQEHNTHSMVSTWPTDDKKTWNGYHKFIDFLNVYPLYPDQPLPVHPKTDKMPYMSSISQHLFIIVFALIPLILHQAYFNYMGHGPGKIAMILFYNGAYTVTAIREVRMLRRLAHKYGCLDGDVAKRDGIPNTGAGKIIGEMHKTAGFRIIMAVLIDYDPTVAPTSLFSDWATFARFVLKLSLYGPLIDVFFYTYHRACHEVPFLWKYHRTHHLAKHPTAVHSGFADDEQEVIEILIVPFLVFTTLWAVGLKLSFFEWWMCFEYVTYSEVWGHSGLRIHGIVPSPISWLLEALDMELAVEDHDIHHRKGVSTRHFINDIQLANFEPVAQELQLQQAV